jgi:hypothetical protein
MKIGDRCEFTAGASTVTVLVCDVRDDGLVLVQNEIHGPGAYSFLVRSDLLTPQPIDVPSAGLEAV